MKVKVVYPQVNKKTFQRRRVIKYLKIPAILIALVLPIVNILVGGDAWSVIVVVGMYMVWHLVISPDLVEYNRISQFIKLSIYSCILILLIDLLLVGGWALEVISIINFGALIVSGFLLYTDFNRQKHNLFPIFFLIIIGFVWATVGLISLNIPSWILVILAMIALLSLVGIILVLKGDFLRELKCRLHLK